jgi:hypothetical protein
MLSRLAGQPSKESESQWIECGSSLLEIPDSPTGRAESHQDEEPVHNQGAAASNYSLLAVSIESRFTFYVSRITNYAL